MIQKIDSRRLQKYILAYSILSMFVISVIVALVSIITLYNRLEVAEEDNLIHALKVRTMVIEEYLSRIKDIAFQITSRTEMARKLELYNEGRIGRREFVTYTRARLLEAMSLPEDVLGITRLDARGEPVVTVGMPIPRQQWPVPAEHSREALIYGEGKGYILVGTPILGDRSARIGTDIVIFGVSTLQRVAEDYSGLGQTGETILGIMKDDHAQLFFPLRENRRGMPVAVSRDSSIGAAMDQATLKKVGIITSSNPHGDPTITAYGPIRDTPWAILVRISDDEFYSTINRMIVVIASVITGLILLSTYGVLLLLRPLTGRMLIHTDDLKRQVEESRWDQEALRESQERLQQLSHHVLQIQENEYKFISRELHDNIAQSLNAVKMRLERLERDAAMGLTEQRREIRANVSQLRRISQEVRNLSKQMRPEILDELGLIAALESYIRDFQQRSGIQTEFYDKTTPKSLQPNVETHLYRIVQEALSNVSKHARASYVVIRLEERDHSLSLQIMDNGVGFSLDQVSKSRSVPQGIGLISIQERTNLLRGTFEIISEPGNGTKIAVRVPLPEPNELSAPQAMAG